MVRTRRVFAGGRKKVVILATLEFFSMKYERASKFKASNYFYTEFRRGVISRMRGGLIMDTATDFSAATGVLEQQFALVRKAVQDLEDECAIISQHVKEVRVLAEIYRRSLSRVTLQEVKDEQRERTD